MMRIINQVPITVLQGASGALSSITPPAFDYGSIVNGSNTINAQFALLFPAGFTGDDPLEGMYRPRFWLEDLINQAQYDWEYKLTATPSTQATTALSGSSAVPRDVQELTNITKSTYWNTTDPNNPTLGYLQVQLQTTAGANPYDTLMQTRSDPKIIVEFERQLTPQLDALDPQGESDHLWNFSQADLYMLTPKNIGGTIYYHRHKLGWIADEDLDMESYQNMVDFHKGKPMGKVVRFMSEIVSSIKGSIASYDPYLHSIALNENPVVNNNRIKMTEVNIQRPVQSFQFALEYVTNAGHRCSFILPKANITFTAANKPGDTNISKYAFTITPWVGVGRTVAIKSITQSPVQQVEISLGYRVT